jgi:diacylglycerol kinase
LERIKIQNNHPSVLRTAPLSRGAKIQKFYQQKNTPLGVFFVWKQSNPKRLRGLYRWTTCCYTISMENDGKVYDKRLSEKKRFSIVARAKSFSFAFRGLKLILKTQHNFGIQILITFIVFLMGLYFDISQTEWMFLVLSSGLVLIAEAFNTAFEFDIDLTSPTFHPYARDTKDVAAGAVLISAIMALVIGLIIFIPKIAILI